MSTNVYQAGQDPSTRSSQCGGEGDGRTAEATEKVIKTFRGILNKLTPDRFESLMNQVDELNINDEETLNTVVELIVDKALLEPSYSKTYVKMCHHLKGLGVSSQSGDGFVYFHKRLLIRCQMEFQIRGLRKEKARLMGTVRFIGELFKLQMVGEPVIHTCIVKLFQDECEDSLECVCRFLSIVGKGLETEAERPKLNSYYRYICFLLKEKKPSNRIRFMLQDLVDLRMNNWVPRRNDQGPKTIQQLHQEVKQAEKRDRLQLKKGQTTTRLRGGGRSADRGRSSNVREIPGKLNQSSSRNCDGDRKQGCHLGNSSKFEIKNTTKPKQREPVVFLNEQNRAKIKSASKIPVEHKTQEEAQVKDCHEEEVYTALKSLLQKNSVNEKIEEWIQSTLNNRRRSSAGFVRALVRAVCQSVIVDCGVYTLRTSDLLQRVSLLKRYIKDDFKQLVALNVLQQLVVHRDQPDGLLRMFFDVLLDEEVIRDEIFFKWRSSAASVTSLGNFFTFLQEAK